MKQMHRHALDGQLARYVASGILNTLTAYLVYAAAIYLGLHYSIAAFVGGGVPVLTGYYVQRRFVFSFRGEGRLLRFFGVFMAAYLLNVGILKFLLESGAIANAYLSGAVALVICAAVSFCLNKHFVFH